MKRRGTVIKRVGVIADTHGLLRPEALDALADSDLILHAGDIGKMEILESLQAIAPVVAVRGNNDHGAWADDLPADKLVDVGEVSIYMVHDVKGIGEAPGIAGVKVVISGHSHKAEVEERGGMLFVNPGSAGPRRFKLPVSVARLLIKGGNVDAKIINLIE